MTAKEFIRKTKKHIWNQIMRQAKSHNIYPYIYRSYWHYLFHPRRQTECLPNDKSYYTARPNPDAGIGHQMANWIARYWYAQQFNLNFAHLPFSNPIWEEFLGFGEGEPSIQDLKRKGYQVRKLPLFNSEKGTEVNLNKKIIQSYQNKKIVFVAEQDQFYMEQYGIMPVLKKKFYSAPARKKDQLIYQRENFNIAIHVRRGDILSDVDNPNLNMRFLSNDYFDKVLKQTVDNLYTDRPIHIYFFSQGKPEDYTEFFKYSNLHWCLHMGAQESFLHMVYADLLITSKSSFSYKPALLNNGIKICPRIFWHGYPLSPDWILVENDGSFDTKQLNSLQF